MGSCQSWLHRHKAGGGLKSLKSLKAKGLRLEPKLESARPRIAFHRVYPGGSNN